MKQGYIQIYTGNGKGKTTAAVGQLIRAAGHGLRCCLIQFMKDYPYGEIQALKRYSELIAIHRFGNDAFVLKKQAPDKGDLQTAGEGLAFASEIVSSEKYDIVVLDEICVAIYFKLVTTGQVLDLLDHRSPAVELILTGRYCPDELIERADLVTEMKEVRHYFQKGVQARKGIES